MTANEILALRPKIEQFLRLFDECFVDDGTRHHLRVYVRGQLGEHGHLQCNHTFGDLAFPGILAHQPASGRLFWHGC